MGPLRAPLLGRNGECATLDRLLASVRDGRSQVLVLRGEAGVGKSALLGHLAGGAAGCRVLRAAGTEFEMELPYAGLHQLCAPMLGRLGQLPEPQAGALATAFGVSAGEPPDRFLVGLAVLSLLAEVAEEEPLLCVIDDAQWLDSASALALAFAARRLLAESVGVVFAARDSADVAVFAGLPEMLVGGLRDEDARALLDSVIRGPLDELVRDRMIAEARGNPLALRELPSASSPSELAGGFGLPDTMPVASRVEEGYLRRIEALALEPRRLMLLAAAEPLGDVTLLWRAAERLGIGADAAATAQATGLIEIGARVWFRHPLVRSAAYRAGSPEDCRLAHRALADVTDTVLAPDRRAWHRAHAASGPDEDVAAELERSADRAQARGGFAAAAAFREKAAELTPDPARQAQRALDGAHAKLQAGAFDQALGLLATAEAGPLDAFRRTRVDLLRAQVAFATSRGSEAPPLLLSAARRMEPLDVGLARETYLDAFSAAMFAGRLAGDTGLHEVARAARAAPAAGRERHPGDMLMDGLSVLFTDGYAAATPGGLRTLRAFREADLSTEQSLHWLWLASIVAADLWDDDSWHALSARHVKLARETGALSELPLALNSRVVAQLFTGELAGAAVLVDEVRAVHQITGSTLAPYGALGLAALRGREREARALIDATLADVMPRGEGIGVTVAQWAAALLLNGLGRHDDALAAARQASELPHELAVANWGLAELVEAAARAGRPDLAVGAAERLADMTGASGTPWALGVQMRSRALVSDGGTAEALYRDALELLARTRFRVELARAHLLYGEWLARSGRRQDARVQLHAAHGLFGVMGADGFTERARRALQATGETVRAPSPATRDALTSQEAQIARLAGEGRTNPEIGAQLFISPRTVEWHLRKVFAKLGISSRRELRGALGGLPPVE